MNHPGLEQARRLAAVLQGAILASGRPDLRARLERASVVLESAGDAGTIRIERRLSRHGPARTEFVELGADGRPELVAHSVETSAMLALERFGVTAG